MTATKLKKLDAPLREDSDQEIDYTWPVKKIGDARVTATLHVFHHGHGNYLGHLRNHTAKDGMVSMSLFDLAKIGNVKLGKRFGRKNLEFAARTILAELVERYEAGDETITRFWTDPKVTA